MAVQFGYESVCEFDLHEHQHLFVLKIFKYRFILYLFLVKP